MTMKQKRLVVIFALLSVILLAGLSFTLYSNYKLRQNLSEEDLQEETTSVVSLIADSACLREINDMILPLEGETYLERQKNFVAIDNINVNLLLYASNKGEIFQESNINFLITEKMAVITIDEKTLNFISYIIYKNENGDIIFEGIDSIRNYYEFIFTTQQELIARGGENVDILNQNSTIVRTCDKGTIILEDDTLQLWCYGDLLCESYIPEPSKEYRRKLFLTDNLYIDTLGNVVLVQTYETDDGELSIEYETLAYYVEEIVPAFSDFGKEFVFKDKIGNYGLLLISNRESLSYANFSFNYYPSSSFEKLNTERIIWLDDENIESVRFISWSTSDDSAGETVLNCWYIEYTVKNYGTIDGGIVYTPANPVTINNEILMELQQPFTVEEYETKFEELKQKTKELDSKS